MKKYKIITLLLTALAITSMSNSPVLLVSADSAVSHATITFEENNSITEPVDPDDPDTPDPELPGTGNSGPLSINYVSDFKFEGTYIVSSSEQTYAVTTEKPNIQISDYRGATGDGWSVTASLSRFRLSGESNTAYTLPGASISISEGRTVTVTGNTSPPPTAAADLTMTSGSDPVKIISATSGSGKGLWITRWYKPDSSEALIFLTVPGNAAQAGEHIAEITWNLSDTP